MICFPNAKINLGLHVVARREDGYHNLETIFYPIRLKDALEIVPTAKTGTDILSGLSLIGEKKSVLLKHKESSFIPKTHFFQTGIPIEGAPENNLVIKALNLIAEEKKIPEIDIHLLKKIPFGAGLGGGSSDAAFMLKLLNDTFELGYTIEELKVRAIQIGADCPFFLLNKPAFATGIGEILEPVTLDLSKYNLLLVKPDIMVSTKVAYSMITPRKAELSLKEIICKPITTWKDLMRNDFELPVFNAYPEIKIIRDKLYKMGAVYASMSGSGSSVFGFFEKEPDWKGAFDQHFVWFDKAVQEE